MWGEFASIVESLSMELLLIDEAGIANATQDNEVVIIRHQGEIEITTEEMAEQLENHILWSDVRHQRESAANP